MGELGGAGYQPAGLSAGDVYEVRTIVGPVFGSHQQVALALSLYGLPCPIDVTQIEQYSQRLLRATRSVTDAIGGRRPTS